MPVIARAARVLPTLLLAACAASGGTPTPEGPPALPEQFLVEYRAEGSRHQTTLDAPVERVAALVPDAYERLGLPVARASNLREVTFITPNLKIEGRLYEGERNSAYFYCGTGLRGEQADIFQLSFVAVTELRATDDGGTVVETMLAGNALDRYRRAHAAPCTGTGKLEAQIGDLLRYELSR